MTSFLSHSDQNPCARQTNLTRICATTRKDTATPTAHRTLRFLRWARNVQWPESFPTTTTDHNPYRSLALVLKDCAVILRPKPHATESLCPSQICCRRLVVWFSACVIFPLFVFLRLNERTGFITHTSRRKTNTPNVGHVRMMIMSSHFEPSRSLHPVLPMSVLIQQTRPIPVVTECKEPTVSTQLYRTYGQQKAKKSKKNTQG